MDGFVTPCRLPEASRRGTVCTVASRVLLVFAAEEVVIRLLLVAIICLNLAQI